MGWVKNYYIMVFHKTGGILAFKKRMEIRRGIKNVNRLKREVVVRIPHDVLDEHDIEAASKDQGNAEDYAEIVGENVVKLGFNTQIEMSEGLDYLHKIETDISDARRNHPGKFTKEIKELGRKFQLSMEEQTDEVEKQERGLYLGELAAIIGYAGKGAASDPNLMAKVAQFMKEKEQVSNLGRLGGRLTIQAIKSGVIALKAKEKKINGELRKLVQKGTEKDHGQAIKELGRLFKDIEANMKKAFEGAYYLLRRDFLLCLTDLNLLNDEEKQMQQYVIQHYMPKALEDSHKEKIEELKERLQKKLQVLAQGFRRIIASEEKLEKEASAELRMAA
ncbi:hypothetical protein HYU14_02640 [Candidatus Woesearchaeota archaeon]|nr:hypothetical protein [Candidatus Woesearchaeota archaeon]